MYILGESAFKGFLVVTRVVEAFQKGFNIFKYPWIQLYFLERQMFCSLPIQLS